MDETTAYLMADDNKLDGTSMSLDHAVRKLLKSPWGALIICPPRPIAVYKAEDPGDLFLLAMKRI